MNKEEVDLVPIYYDPVHDFGFFRFNPKAVKFLEVAEIELNPDGAKGTVFSIHKFAILFLCFFC